VSTPSAIARLPLAVMAAILAALTLGALVVAADSRLNSWGWWRFGFFAIPVVVAVYYLTQYRKLPYERWYFFPRPETPPSAPAGGSGTTVAPTGPATPTAPVAPAPSPGATAGGPPSGPAPEPGPSIAPAAAEGPADDEPFVDPVEEADRLEQERARKERATGPEESPSSSDSE
jgi:hypothetical protein